MGRKFRTAGGSNNAKGNPIPSRADLIVKNAKSHFSPTNFVSKNFSKFESEKIENQESLKISCLRRDEMETSTLKWALSLTEKNMRDLYEASEWGWKEDEKKEELFHPDALYLLARDGEGVLKGFVHFRMDTDFGKAVLYCYEIQLEEAVRRKGLGQFFMEILLRMAFEIKMAKVVLTVLKNNEAAINFYLKKLDFKIDETSPSVSTKEDVCYEILSKRASGPV